MGTESNSLVAAELDEQHIDAIVLEYQTPIRWSGTCLYGYLTSTWKRMDQPAVRWSSCAAKGGLVALFAFAGVHVIDPPPVLI
jgi:hypothetical protein